MRVFHFGTHSQARLSTILIRSIYVWYAKKGNATCYKMFDWFTGGEAYDHVHNIAESSDMSHTDDLCTGPSSICIKNGVWFSVHAMFRGVRITCVPLLH